jgi:SOS-response transcriptional repressor LexA
MWMALDERIQEIVDAGFSRALLARAAHVTAAAVTHWLKGDSKQIKSEAAAGIQKKTGFNAVWIATGEGPKKVGNVESGPIVKSNKRYPVISYVQAGEWTHISDNFAPGDAEQWAPSAHDLGQNGYMLRVRGDSMLCPHGPYSFPEGILLHVNPHLEPTPGRFVIVRRQAEETATFKKYVMVEGEPYLEAINPDWPSRYIKMQQGDTFCGVVIHAGWDMP